MEQVINRSDLVSDESVKSSSPEPTLVARVKALGDFEYVEQRNLLEQQAQPEEGNDDDVGLDFRLFSTAQQASTAEAKLTTSKINLRSPSPANGEPGFIQPLRNEDYYFSKTPSAIERLQLEQAAVSGVDVITRSKNHWPGCSYSWKVLHLPITKKQLNASGQTSQMFGDLIDNGKPAFHKRLGKKARIKIRTKRDAFKKQQQDAQRSAEDKAAAEREKRNRRNREKKIKRRARDRAKKADDVAEPDSPD